MYVLFLIALALLTHCNLCVAYYLVVELITRLDTVYYLAFIVVAHAGNHCHGFVIIYIEVFSVGINLLYAKAFKCLYELVVNEGNAFFHGFGVLVVVGKSTFKVVENGKDGSYGLLAAVEQEFCLFLECAFLVVVKLGYRTQILVFELGDFFFGFCKFVLFLCNIVSLCPLFQRLSRFLYCFPFPRFRLFPVLSYYLYS